MKPGRRTIMVATSAFGSASTNQHPLHRALPGAGVAGAVCQEAGRAGRDGRKANCVLLFDPKDRETTRPAADQPRATDQLYRIARLCRLADEERVPSSRL